MINLLGYSAVLFLSPTRIRKLLSKMKLKSYDADLYDKVPVAV